MLNASIPCIRLGKKNPLRLTSLLVFMVCALWDDSDDGVFMREYVTYPCVFYSLLCSTANLLLGDLVPLATFDSTTTTYVSESIEDRIGVADASRLEF